MLAPRKIQILPGITWKEDSASPLELWRDLTPCKIHLFQGSCGRRALFGCIDRVNGLFVRHVTDLGIHSNLDGFNALRNWSISGIKILDKHLVLGANASLEVLRVMGT